jgi:hypothetical protein
MIRDIPERISLKKSDIQKKEKEFSFVEKTVILGEINMTAIDTEIEILKIKIVYRRKVAIFQVCTAKTQARSLNFI